ncbi:MAG: Nif3-like dinuclear metal center hexameric protein, partial [Bacteroidota bacterium]
FLHLIKGTFHSGGVRYADFPGNFIQRVAVCGGAGSFLTRQALKKGADAFVTGDITYHKFFDNENRMLLMDIGHYESEQFTSDLIYSFLSKKFPNFAVRLSEVYTNPVKYF